MMMRKLLTPVSLTIVRLTLVPLTLVLMSGQGIAHEKHAHKEKPTCAATDVSCAKTVTSAFAPNGKLWRLWSGEQHMFYSVSSDKGKTFGEPVKVDIKPEEISSRGENRPKLGFDSKNNVYLSWAKPLKKRYTAEVRFTFSTDGGKHFAEPITVNNDGLEIGHSYNEMLVSNTGEVTITWLDGRERKKQTNYVGSALYSATGKLGESGFSFNNTKLADQTCVCCRIAMTYTADNKIAAMWRHIYGDNIRDHAILTFDAKSSPVEPYRASFDEWKIDGCPHQGPGLSINEQNRYHMVWFNNGSKGKGLFYANSDNAGQKQSKPLPVGDFDARSSYAHVIVSKYTVDVVWTQFDGKKYQLYHQRSVNNGDTFAKATVIGQSTADADRPFLIQHRGAHFVSWQRPNLGHQVIAL
jgi:hypothetical protein